MRKKRDKRQARTPWYVRPMVYRIIILLARALIDIFN
jgi:hypothetical protein